MNFIIRLRNKTYFLPFLLLIIASFPFKLSGEEKYIIKFELRYETLQPVKIKSAQILISPDKILGKSDSLNIYWNDSALFLDTLYAKYPWKFPVHARVRINLPNKKFITNKFYLDPLNKSFLLSISDTSAEIKGKPSFQIEDKKSYLGIILIIQTIIQIIITILITKIFKWPTWSVFLVIAANLASVPVYMLQIEPKYLTDIIIALIQFAILFLTGKKQLGTIKIIAMVLMLIGISFGFKQIMLLVLKVI